METASLTVASHSKVLVQLPQKLYRPFVYGLPLVLIEASGLLIQVIELQRMVPINMVEHSH